MMASPDPALPTRAARSNVFANCYFFLCPPTRSQAGSTRRSNSPDRRVDYTPACLLPRGADRRAAAATERDTANDSALIAAIVSHGGGLLAVLPTVDECFRGRGLSPRDAVALDGARGIYAVGTPAECFAHRERLRGRGHSSAADVSPAVTFVRPAYVTDCAARGQRLPYEPYVVFKRSNNSVVRRAPSPGHHTGASNTPVHRGHPGDADVDWHGMEDAIAQELHRVADALQREIDQRCVALSGVFAAESTATFDSDRDAPAAAGGLTIHHPGELSRSASIASDHLPWMDAVDKHVGGIIETGHEVIAHKKSTTAV